MKTFLVERKAANWCEDFAIVVIAEDAKHAERKARLSSDDFRKDQTVTVEEVNMDEEQCILVANTGA